MVKPTSETERPRRASIGRRPVAYCTNSAIAGETAPAATALWLSRTDGVSRDLLGESPNRILAAATPVQGSPPGSKSGNEKGRRRRRREGGAGQALKVALDKNILISGISLPCSPNDPLIRARGVLQKCGEQLECTSEAQVDGRVNSSLPPAGAGSDGGVGRFCL
jgi:hypothetical protein